MAFPCPPTSSTSTSTPSTRSSTAPAASRRSRRARPSSRCPRSRSPTTARSPARSSSTARPRKHGVKPLIGCEVYVADDRRAQTKGYAHLTLLAETNEGYGNLIKLASAGYLEGYYYKPRVDWELLERTRRGSSRSPAACPAASARRSRRTGPGTPPPTSTGSCRSSAATSSTSRSRTPASTAQARINPLLAELARESGLPLVATGDVHYLMHEDARAHEALLCIQSGDSLKNPNRWKFDTDQFYFKTPAEMAARLRRPRRARSRRTLEIAERCNVEIELGRPAPAEVPGPRTAATPSTTSSSSARRASRSATARSRRSSRERLQFELKTIREMGFADYFLIVWDFIALREAERDQRRPRPRLGGRLARRLLPRDHRRRPDPLRPAVRALPQPGPQVDARHGHRLRGRRARPRHQLRGREVRPRPRRPDHHLRDDDGPRRRARRRPRARDPVRHGRQGREADPGRAEGLPRRLPQAGRRAAQGLRRRPAREGDRRPGQAARGPRPRRTRSTPPAS